MSSHVEEPASAAWHRQCSRVFATESVSWAAQSLGHLLPKKTQVAGRVGSQGSQSLTSRSCSERHSPQWRCFHCDTRITEVANSCATAPASSWIAIGQRSAPNSADSNGPRVWWPLWATPPWLFLTSQVGSFFWTSRWFDHLSDIFPILVFCSLLWTQRCCFQNALCFVVWKRWVDGTADIMAQLLFSIFWAPLASHWIDDGPEVKNTILSFHMFSFFIFFQNIFCFLKKWGKMVPFRGTRSPPGPVGLVLRLRAHLGGRPWLSLMNQRVSIKAIAKYSKIKMLKRICWNGFKLIKVFHLVFVRSIGKRLQDLLELYQRPSIFPKGQQAGRDYTILCQSAKGKWS